ncbi:hypothetical protein GN958_ATG03154 [Phytophthora infestans]|uniref:CCHC-type domain-containing protein n=1 Tax=Phytophthora infestans TaxID=4787 RepID=A0A8S9V9C7_PHYIN|nr:hypothetical protein GN958_ATG03154 [Phytophthora infestans]
MEGSLCCRRTALSNLSSCPPARPFAQQFLSEQQPAPTSADETLVQAIATAAVRALSAVRTGPQQVVDNPSGNPPEEGNGQLPSPRPQRNLDAEISASLTPYGNSLSAPFEPRSPSPSAYETGTRSSSDKTIKNNSMGTWQASQIQLASTKFDGKVENWSRWKTEMQTIFPWQGLLQLVQGREEFDQARADRSQEWKNCFETRERKAHTEIVLSLHGDLLDRFKSDIEMYLKEDMYARRLRQGEGVMDYINDLQRMRRELEQMDVSLPEGEMASVVLSNAVNVYPLIANEHTQRVSRLRGGYDKDQRVQDAVNLLLVAERTAQEQKDRSDRNNGQGVQRQVNAVSHHQGSNRQQHGGKRHHSDFQERKRTTECKSCHKRGHWWKECPDRKATNREEIRTMAGSVLRRVKDSTRVEDSGRSVIQDDVVECYSTIYTRHELSALIGRDSEERLLRARDAQREDESIEYSPTSPPDDEDEDKRGARGLSVVRRVLAATTNGGTGVVPADEIDY